VNVSGKLLARPYSARERNIDFSLARSRLLNKPDDVTVGDSYTIGVRKLLKEHSAPIFTRTQLDRLKIGQDLKIVALGSVQ
jgi:hypothetical protein